MKNLAVIGCGNIGGALVRGVSTKYKVRVYDLDQSRLQELQIETGALAASSMGEAVKDADIVVLAVKPKHFPKTLEELCPLIENPVVVSVAAGVKVAEITAVLGNEARVVRVMPNLAMSLGMSMSAIYGASDVPMVEELFSIVGETVVVEDEGLIDVSTAVAGSGPAFFFQMIAAMGEAAQEQGLSKEQGLKMAIQTARGAAELLKQSDILPEAFIKRVATPGGTTEAGLEALRKGDFFALVVAAVAASTERAREDLSKGAGK